MSYRAFYVARLCVGKSSWPLTSGGDIYSLGNLSIDRDGLGTCARSILNSSGSLQSDGHMRLAASTIDNVRQILTTHDAGIYTASIREVACIEGTICQTWFSLPPLQSPALTQLFVRSMRATE
nr:hypothetical protein [Pseudomonas sp. QTF5]